MHTPLTRETLRPLSVGEILDRAVSISVRRFWLFAAIWLPYYGALFVLFAFLERGNTDRQVEQGAVRLFTGLLMFVALPLPFAALTWSANESFQGGMRTSRQRIASQYDAGLQSSGSMRSSFLPAARCCLW